MDGMDEIDAQLQEGQQYLAELEIQRQQCEQEGRWYEAQECIDRMRQYTIRQGKKLERASKDVNANELRAIKEKQDIELKAFAQLWDERWEEYEHQARQMIEDVKERQRLEYAEREDMIKQELMEKRPHFSKEVLRTRSMLERLVREKKYLEAEELRKRLRPLEMEEIQRFDEGLSVTLTKKTKLIKEQHQSELSALRQRVKRGKDELKVQRQMDIDRLERHHQNVLRALEQKTRLHVSKTKDYINKQLHIMQNAPTKTGVDYRLTPRPESVPAYMTALGPIE